MNDETKEIRKIFPTSKEIAIAGKTLLVKPMVWADFLELLSEFGKVFEGMSKDDPSFDLTQFSEKDTGRLVPVIREVLNIFAKWLKVDVKWLTENLTAKGTMELIILFLEVNEWEEVSKLFFQAKLKVQVKKK